MLKYLYSRSQLQKYSVGLHKGLQSRTYNKGVQSVASKDEIQSSNIKLEKIYRRIYILIRKVHLHNPHIFSVRKKYSIINNDMYRDYIDNNTIIIIVIIISVVLYNMNITLEK